MVHRDHFLLGTNRIDLLNLKKSSDRPVIVAKPFLKPPNMEMPTRQKSPSFSINLALRTFGKFLIVFSKRVNLLYLLYSIACS